MNQKVDYDSIAQAYDRRFIAGQSIGIAQSLDSLVKETAFERVLEAGCGTGHWLRELKECVPFISGLDLSSGMLQCARQQGVNLLLARGDAGDLPFPSGSFDLVYCINALHHFAEPYRFIAEACRVLKEGGALAVIGLDPHWGGDDWYIYDYFPRAREIDLARFPAVSTLIDWMLAAGFKTAACQPAEYIRGKKNGIEVLSDAFLQKNMTSQLVLLTDEEYAEGLATIKADLAEATTAGEELIFYNSITLWMVTARL